MVQNYPNYIKADLADRRSIDLRKGLKSPYDFRYNITAMITQLKNALSKARRNPRYLWYFWQNINVIRDHFPRLYRFLLTHKSLDLGGGICLSKFHVILRTKDFVMNINSSRQLEEVGIKTRNDVIRVGGCSLFPAAAQFVKVYGKENIRITLVVDRLSEEGMRQYRTAAESENLDFDVVEAKGQGNGPTFQTQIDMVLRDADDTLALILEDDYQLDGKAFTICFKLMRDHSKVIGMNPHFHPDRVRFQDTGKLAVIDGRLFCRVPSTCCTFFMPVRQMRRFERCLRLYDGWENGSVNVAWRKEICLAPLGWTMAEHLHRCDLSPVSENDVRIRFTTEI